MMLNDKVGRGEALGAGSGVRACGVQSMTGRPGISVSEPHDLGRLRASVSGVDRLRGLRGSCVSGPRRVDLVAPDLRGIVVESVFTLL